MRLRALFLLGILFLAAPTCAYAWGEQGPVRKLCRGVANLATGWLDFPAEIAKTTERSGSMAAVSVGLGRGLFFGIGRTLVGGFETVTFLFPSGSYGYGPMVRPEFVTFRDNDRW